MSRLEARRAFGGRAGGGGASFVGGFRKSNLSKQRAVVGAGFWHNSFVLMVFISSSACTYTDCSSMSAGQ